MNQKGISINMGMTLGLINSADSILFVVINMDIMVTSTIKFFLNKHAQGFKN